jgi:hypothetical protein
MKVKISTAELRVSVLAFLRHLEETGQSEFDITEEFYWDISVDRRYSPYEEPKELTIGQLSDDWVEVKRMVDGSSDILGYGLVWLASVLRRVGEKAVG